MPWTAAVPVALAFTCPVLVFAIGWFRPRLAGPAATILSVLAFVAIGGAAWTETPAVALAWIPAWDVSLHLELDGLGLLFALLATGICALVCAYSVEYMPHHVTTPRDLPRFFFLITLFMAAMVGLVASRDLYSLVICWDLTAITSFLLIGFDSDVDDARAAARMALVVTAGSAVLLVVAAVGLHVWTGTADLDEVFAAGVSGPAAVAVALMVVSAAAAKSAQVPLHFWLPRAMVAPTPVSAYLHSAAMVAAGVFLLARFYPLLSDLDTALTWMRWLGMASIGVGSLLALGEDDVKGVLAYSTIAQYGYVVWLLGLGSAEAATAAAFYVGVHALAKSGLFLTAGAVVRAADGERRLSALGGLAPALPALAGASAVCAAALTALPLTAGFFKDELFFHAAHQRGALAMVVAVGAAALTFSYTWRLWSRVFLGRPIDVAHPVGWLLLAPVAVLAGLLVLGGVAPDPYTHLAERAGAVIHSGPAPAETAYHLDARPTNLMALAAWGLGGLLLAAMRRRARPWTMLARAGERAGAERLYILSGRALGRLSDWVHGIEVRDLRDRAAAVLVPGGLLVGMALVLAPGESPFVVGTLAAGDLPLVAMLGLTALAAMAASQPRRHLPTLLALSLANYGLALAFGFIGAPDVALVAMLVQTVFTLLIVAVLSLFSPDRLAQAARADQGRAARTLTYTAVATVGAFLFAWTILSWAAPPVTSYAYVEEAPKAHARDVVTAVLADFRGLDTLAEATVLAVALLGTATILRWHRSGSS
jgi:multicomponent Na+:H+ antiporter subunit A